MGIQDAANATFWITDLLFAVAFGAALFSPKAKKAGIKVATYISKNWIYEGKQILPHHERFIAKRAGKVLYWTIYYMMYLVLITNLFMNFALEKRRNGLLNVLYTVYPLVTLQSAHDVILHDDKSEWPEDAKFFHVLLPFSWDDKKLFVKKLASTEVDKHYASLMKESRNVIGMISYAALGAFIYRFFPPALKFLCGMPFVFSSFETYKVLNTLVDLVSVKYLRNRYEHPFGDVFAVVKSADKHDELGMQYEYFKRSFKPLENFCYNNFFSRARGAGASIGQSKAAYYLGRGAVVIATLSLLNLLGKEGNEPLAAVIIANYYVLHAAYAYWAQHLGYVVTDYSKKTHPFEGKAVLDRYTSFLVCEGIASPFLYMPIAARLVGTA